MLWLNSLTLLQGSKYPTNHGIDYGVCEIYRSIIAKKIYLKCVYGAKEIHLCNIQTFLPKPCVIGLTSCNICFYYTANSNEVAFTWVFIHVLDINCHKKMVSWSSSNVKLNRTMLHNKGYLGSDSIVCIICRINVITSHCMEYRFLHLTRPFLWDISNKLRRSGFLRE